MSDLLSVEDLTVEFWTPAGTIRAVNKLSFRIRRGEVVALVGESGSGKSATGLALLGLLPRVAKILGGRMLFRDGDAPPVDLASLSPRSRAFRAIRGNRISMIFQEPTVALSPLHTIGNQIGEALRLHRDVDRGQAHREVVAALEAVGFTRPEEAAHKYPFELSGGLNQRAMIAMATICRPALLIADEPTTALDVTVQAEVMRLLMDLKERHGTAILLVAHDLGVVANMADEMVVMHHGEAMERGTVRDLFHDPRHPYLKGLIGAVPRLGMDRGARLRPLREIPVPPVRSPARPAAEAGRTLLRVDDVSKVFHPRPGAMLAAAPRASTYAVRNVSFEIRRGECLGLVGESGCGKTTLSKIVARSESADEGRIEMFDADGAGTDVLGLSGEALRRWRRRVQYVFQNPYSALNPRMTVGGIVAEPLLVHGIGDERSRKARVKELIRLVGLDESHLNRHPNSFSGGQRQRIGIARALALEPELIVFDEPVSALDVSVQAQILNLVRDLKDRLGLTCLFISHNLAVVDYLADRIMVMAAGRLVEIAPREVLFREPRHPYTRALIAAIPEPDPDSRLDLSKLSAGRRSDPATWPRPYGGGVGSAEPGLIEVAPEHFVRSFVAGTPDAPRSAPHAPTTRDGRVLEPAGGGGEA